MRCAVCVVRSIGLAYTAATGSSASRSAAASACPTPFSERSIPGMRPESNGPVCAVTACRTSTRRVGGLGASAGASVGASAPGATGSSVTGWVIRPRYRRALPVRFRVYEREASCRM